MRHRKIRSKLNRTTEHRLSMMRNLASSLIRHERIRTTHTKAMQLRGFVEPLVTLAKDDSVNARRRVYQQVGKRDVVLKLFGEIGPRVGDRPGGYLRVVKDNPRAGDGALMAFVEFVDAAPAAPEKKQTLEQRMRKRVRDRQRGR